MTKYKRFFVTKTTTTVYEAYDKTPEEALDMVKNKTSKGFAGRPTERGYNPIMFDTPLVEFKVSTESLEG